MTGRRESRAILLSIIELAGTALVLWLMAEDERMIRPKLWLAVTHGSRRAAEFFGRIALRAEHNYHTEVNQ